MKLYKKLALIGLSSVMVLASAATALGASTYSDAWAQDAKGIWHAKDASGAYLKNCWFCDDAIAANGKNVWYLIDGNGNMIIAGLVQDGTGNFYSIETNHTGYYGMLRYKNGTYDCNGQKIYLEFNQTHGGSFGAVTNPAGLEALKAIYGVTSVANINNSNAKYSSTWVKGTSAEEGPGGPGGGSGGGSGGGGGGGSSSGGGGGGGSSSGSGSSSGGSASQTNAERDVINQFKSTYITAGMNDFEKEMTIIMWMVENIDYDVKWYNSGSVTSSRSYESAGALVDKLAVCDGYSKAFMKLAQACGLTVKRVTGTARNEGHSWNQIKLNGKWYNVDVTWEDPYIGSKGSCRPNDDKGFWNLNNNYINLTDEHFTSHHASSSKETCNSTEFGPDVVAYYLEHHEYKPYDEAIADAETESQNILNGYEEKGTLITYTGNAAQLEDDIVAYVTDLIINRVDKAEICVSLGNAYDRSVTGDYSKASEFINGIKNAANARIAEEYGPVTDRENYSSLLYLSPSSLPNHRMYCKQTIYLYYKEGSRKPVEVTIHYADVNTEAVLKTDSFTSELQAKHDYEFPDGYKYSSKKSVDVISGTVSKSAKGITIGRESGDVELTVYVEENIFLTLSKGRPNPEEIEENKEETIKEDPFAQEIKNEKDELTDVSAEDKDPVEGQKEAKQSEETEEIKEDIES